MFYASDKGRALIGTEKIAYEYLNNGNRLMSKSEPFFQKSKMSPTSFYYSCVNNSLKKGICRTFLRAIGSV